MNVMPLIRCGLLSLLLAPPGGIAAPAGGLPAADAQAIGFSTEHAALIRELLASAVADGQVAGVVAGVARHGRLVLLESHGWQDREQQLPMTDDAIFQIRSMSKPVTAVAALQLIEQGRLRLDDPVSRYIPRFGFQFVFINPDEPFLSAERKPSRPMTIEDLLLNTAGLSHRNSLLYQQRRVRDRADTLEVFANKVAGVPLIGDPGAQWVYSESISVLGRVVEVVSGQPLDDYLQDHVYGPLGMQDTAFFVPAEKVQRLVKVYRRDGDSGELTVEPEMEVPITEDPPLLEGAAGLVSTVPDYLRFLQALLNQGELDGERILQPATVVDMTRNHIAPELLPIGTNPDSPMLDRGWGYGLAVVIDAAKSEFGVNDGEFGWNGSLGTYSWADPVTGTVAVLMLQIQPASAGGLPGRFKDLVHNGIIE
ncbi:MAG: hypothetical protein RLZZ385_559 [Pseudomonadota bacterium]|jgi:CubicO group peptidase (beta-lactamase class C family)